MKFIDLFAGCGGFTEGARQAGGDVVWAANHWPVAVEAHARNHPEAAHACQDLQQADFGAVPDCDVVLASPCCQGHTRAKGKERPGSDASRATAWAVVSAVEAKRPRALIVENVPEFRDWLLYPSWVHALSRLGYVLTETVVDAADLGVPQHRRRLIVFAVRTAFALVPEVPRMARVPAAEIVDFDAGVWSEVDKPGRAEKTLRRVEAGRRDVGERFLMPYYSKGSGLTGRPLSRPIGTITTKDRWAVVDGDRMRMLSVDECRAAMGFPPGYALPEKRVDAIKALGNAIPPPMARWAVQQVQRHLGGFQA